MAKQRFTRRQKLNKGNTQNTPDDKPVVYKVLDKKGENIYTGVAKAGRVQERLKEHMRGRPDAIPGADSFSVKQKKSIGGAETEEKRIIQQEKPAQNEQNK